MYTRQNFKNGEILTAENLEAIEDAILEIETDVSNNIEKGTGTGSVQQVIDGNEVSFVFSTEEGKPNNPNAVSDDATLLDSHQYGAKGDYASSFGGKSSAQGKRSFTYGHYTIAKEAYSYAGGECSVATGRGAYAIGKQTYAKGEYAFAAGNNTVAKYPYQAVFGKYNNNLDNTLLEVGDGSEGAPRNAFEIYSNGFAYIREGLKAGRSTLMTDDDKSFITKDYLNIENVANNCLQQKSSNSSFSAGCSFSVAFNSNNMIKGNNSFVAGLGNNCYQSNLAVFGTYSKEDADNALFIIGKGDSDSSRSNALVVYKDATAKLGEDNIITTNPSNRETWTFIVRKDDGTESTITKEIYLQ